tara:strand:- start:129 stop:1541 length:1413 start_codon:yes stop_codon:yes gene_type:complete
MKTLSDKDIKSFLTFEKELNLNQIRYKNQKVWPIIRWGVYDAILAHQGKAQRAVSTKKITQRPPIARKFLKLLMSSMSFYNIFGKTDVLLFNYGRRLDFKDKEDNLLVWTFSEALSENYSLTTVDQYNIYPRGSKNIINICELLSLFSYIASLFLRFTKWIQLENELNSRIKKFYNFEIQLRQIYISNFIYQKSMGILSKLIIKIKRPKIIVYSDTGSFSEVIRTAKLDGIKTLDYQHALQSGQNLLYAHNPDLIREYKEYLSDYVMTFGDYWGKYFSEYYKTIAIGSSYQELMIEDIKNISQDEQSIIFISDGEMARREFENLAIIIAKRIPELKIYYRLRPDEFSEWKRLYSKKIQQVDNIIFLDSNDNSLHSYFKKCQYVIGINSTALIEALPISNVIVHKKGWYIEMEEFIKNNYVLSSSNAEDIINIIQQKKLPKRSIDKEKIFKSNCKKNIKASIDEIFLNEKI